jgi:DNA excision repair protein ERCC-4
MTASDSFSLPALRGDIAKLRPIVAIDSREQNPLRFTRLESRVVSLPTADYGLYNCEGAAAIERKGSLDELVTCLSVERDRFERELMRMKSYPFRRLIIISSRGEIELQRYRSRISPKAVLNTLSAFEVRYDLPTCYFPTPEAAALQVESWIWWIARQIVKDANALLKASTEKAEEVK